MNHIKRIYLDIERLVTEFPKQKYPDNISYAVSWYYYTKDSRYKDAILGDIVLSINDIREELISYIDEVLSESDDNYLEELGYASKSRMLEIKDNIKKINTHDDVISLSEGKIDLDGDRLYIQQRVVDKIVFNYLYYGGYNCPEKLFDKVIDFKTYFKTPLEHLSIYAIYSFNKNK